MLRSLDLSDRAVAERVVTIQHAAYRVKADLIGFDGIPPLHDTVDCVQAHELQWVGSFDEEMLAAVIAWRIDGAVCDIDRLAVDPAFARRGHGRRLVESVLTHPTVVVSTGTANTPARALYDSLGFVVTGERAIADSVTVTSYVRSQSSAP